MSSRRLPGKVLREIAGRPLLQWTIERVRRAKSISNIVVATSVLDEDDPIETLCQNMSVKCFRGDLNDVRSRYIAIATNTNIRQFVRICGDSPLIDPALIDQGVYIASSGNFDLVTNILVRTYPIGQSVEIVSTRALLRLADEEKEQMDIEHVTVGFYRKNSNYRVESFTHDRDYGDIRLAVDTEQDLQSISKIVSSGDAMSLGWEALANRAQSLNSEVKSSG